jgi:hypothetical protein
MTITKTELPTEKPPIEVMIKLNRREAEFLMLLAGTLCGYSALEYVNSSMTVRAGKIEAFDMSFVVKYTDTLYQKIFNIL